MRMTAPILTCLLFLAACGSKQTKPTPQAEDPGAPQVATSIEDVDLPVDKSDRITSIDAATGDAGGMPRDGGAAIPQPKAQTAARPARAESADIAPQPDATPVASAAAAVPDAQ